jgi:hypothetical protein
MNSSRAANRFFTISPSPNFEHPTSNLQSQVLSTSSKLFTTFCKRDPLFSTLSKLFAQKTPGWGYAPTNVRTKYEACIPKTSQVTGVLPLRKHGTWAALLPEYSSRLAPIRRVCLPDHLPEYSRWSRFFSYVLSAFPLCSGWPISLKGEGIRYSRA